MINYHCSLISPLNCSNKKASYPDVASGCWSHHSRTECSKPLASVGPDRGCPRCFQASKIPKSGAVEKLIQSKSCSRKIRLFKCISNDCFCFTVSLLHMKMGKNHMDPRMSLNIEKLRFFPNKNSDTQSVQIRLDGCHNKDITDTFVPCISSLFSASHPFLSQLQPESFETPTKMPRHT